MVVFDRRDGSTTTSTASTASSTQLNTPSQTLSASPDAGARINHCSIVKDSVLYVFGGVPSSNSSSIPVFASLNLTAPFDNSDKLPSWEELPSQDAIPVINGQCVLTDTHLLVVGGQPLDPSKINPFSSNKSITYCGLQAYSFAEQGWQSLLPQQTNSENIFIALNRTGHTAGWLTDVGNGSPGLFVMGGIHYNATIAANDAFVFSPFTIPSLGGQAIIGAASIPNNLPPPTINSGSAVVKGGTSILVFGGTVSPTQQQLTTIWEYTPKINTWKTLPVSLPHGMPNAKTGWVDDQLNLITVDVSSANTLGDVSVIPLANAGLRRRQITQSSPPSKLDGSSLAFDPLRDLAIISGGDGVDSNNINIFNKTSNSWSVLSLKNNDLPTTTTTSSAPSSTTTTTPLQTSPGSRADSTGFNKANLLAPIILGGVLGLLGLLGLILLVISYRHRKTTKKAKGRSPKSITPGGLWLKYGNQKADPISQALGGEIFLRNLEEKHGLKRNPTNDRRKTGWSKYFSASWYHSSNPRASGSTSGTAQALVNETREQTGPYGGGWDNESRFSKASSFMSVVSVSRDRQSESGRWSGGGSKWDEHRKTRASNASSGVLGDTLGSTLGAGGVNRF